MEESRVFEHEEGFSLCLRVRERLQDLYEGYLDAMVAETIRAHLNSCFQCNREYRDLEQTIRLIETLPYAEPIQDFTPAIMTAIRGQSGYSFQAPVVEVETESVVSSPRSITGIELRQRDFGFSILDFGLPKSEQFTVRERAVGVFGLVAAFLALVFGPFTASSALSLGYAGMGESASQIPLLGPFLAFIAFLLARSAESVVSILQTLSSLPAPIVSLGGGAVAAFLFARFARKRENRALAWRYLS